MQSTKQTDLQLWNAAAMAAFIIFAVGAYWLTNRYGEIKPLGFFEFALLALATFRLAHLFTNDKIFDFVRVIVFDRRGRRLANSEQGWRRILCEILECLWCAGLWSALIVITVYQFGQVGSMVIALLAVAGAAALLSILSKALAER